MPIPSHPPTQIDWAKSLNDEYLNNEQSRMNEVMYLLTMTTVVLLPAQFLTGVFGACVRAFVFWVVVGKDGPASIPNTN